MGESAANYAGMSTIADALVAPSRRKCEDGALAVLLAEHPPAVPARSRCRVEGHLGHQNILVISFLFLSHFYLTFSRKPRPTRLLIPQTSLGYSGCRSGDFWIRAEVWGRARRGPGRLLNNSLNVKQFVSQIFANYGSVQFPACSFLVR